MLVTLHVFFITYQLPFQTNRELVLSGQSRQPLWWWRFRPGKPRQPRHEHLRPHQGQPLRPGCRPLYQQPHELWPVQCLPAAGGGRPAQHDLHGASLPLRTSRQLRGQDKFYLSSNKVGKLYICCGALLTSTCGLFDLLFSLISGGSLLLYCVIRDTFKFLSLVCSLPRCLDVS